MPWTPEEATSHTKKSTTEKAKRHWAEIANQDGHRKRKAVDSHK